MKDDLEERLRALRDGLPKARKNLSDEEKDLLIKVVGGPKTALSIRKAMKDFPQERIPFLFSSLDTQAVVDIMANDVDAAIVRALASKN